MPTVSRMLSEFDDHSVALQQETIRDLVLERLQKEAFQTVTMDFDGSVQSIKRHAEGTTVGYNKENKGARQLLSAVLHDRPQRPGTRVSCTAVPTCMIPKAPWSL